METTVQMTSDGYIRIPDGSLVGITFERGGELQIEVLGTYETDILEHKDCVKLFDASEDDADDVFEFLTSLGIGKFYADIIANKTCANILRAHGYVW